jgi:glutamate/tyrosine decarboxylase-like PLP-dependent enzyme
MIPLQPSAEEMRAFGYRIIDMIVEHITTLPGKPVAGGASRAELESLLHGPPPTNPIPADALLERLRRDVFANMTHLDHPRFFAYVPSPGNFVGAMADALGAGLNPFAGAWAMASGMAQVELVTVGWLREICGLPEGAGGLFVSGGSMANLTALAAARHVALDDLTDGAVIYCSDQTHSSIDRAAKLLGLHSGRIRKLTGDERFRLSPDDLKHAIAADRAAGLRPFCVVGNAGTTSTGAIDPLNDLADICAAEELWLHVDGAYGAAAAITRRGREALAGMERADSISLDPHKWLFQPIECGCVLLRDERNLPATFRSVPGYLRDSDLGTAEMNFRDHGIQLTRSFRALKLWMSILYFGLDAFRDAVERGMELAETAERRLRESGRWEIVSPAAMGIVAFGYRIEGVDGTESDALNRRIAERSFADGHALLSTTLLRDRTVLRLCTINPRTTDVDITGTITRLEELAAEG